MTAIIISLLAALGIGGGVMLASSGGGGDSGGAAVVAPVNPGGGGGGSNTGGSNTGGSNTGGNTGGGTSGGTTGSSNVGTLLAKGSLNGITTIGKEAQGNTTLSGKNLTIGVDIFAPVLVNGTTYETNENYLTAATTNGNQLYVAGYKQPNPKITQTINLATIKNSNAFADFYTGTTSQTKTIATLNATFIARSSYLSTDTFTNVTWTYYIKDFALGARQFSLQNSEFGYYTWRSTYSGGGIGSKYIHQNHFDKFGAQSFYMFDTSKQFTGSNYTSRYGNTATFNGNVIGAIHPINYVCGSNNASYQLTGNINLSLNLANKTLSGNMTNMIINDRFNWYDFSLNGNINTVSAGSPNITFTEVDFNKNQSSSISYARYDSSNLHPLNNSDNFGDAVIVKGANASKDEMVGRINFTNRQEGTGTVFFYDAYLSFGAKKQ